MHFPRKRKAAHTQLIMPGIIGNILEWYDFSLYGYFAPIIAQLFFPMESEFISLLATFGVFAIGFLMRPLGALLFGFFGDRIGRKKTLAIAVILMAIPTTLIGLLPTYLHIGAFASILLTTCRLLQGLAVGGEFAGSIVYVTEHAPSNRRGLYGSWAMFSAFAGILLGSGVAAIFSTLPNDMLMTWGWRIPFLLGLLLGIIGLYLRLRMPETPSFLALEADHRVLENPIQHAFKTALEPMGTIIGLVFLPAMSFYLLFVYLSSYMTTVLNVSLHTALTINTISMLAIIFFIPSIGMLSDRIGRKAVLTIGALGFVVFSYPLFSLLQHGTFWSLLIAQICFAILVSFSYAAIPATAVELVGTNIRYTSISFPYNVANAIFGGTAPLVATYLIGKTGNPLAPSWYLIIAGIIMLFFIYHLKESFRKGLKE